MVSPCPPAIGATPTVLITRRPQRSLGCVAPHRPPAANPDRAAEDGASGDVDSPSRGAEEASAVRLLVGRPAQHCPADNTDGSAVQHATPRIPTLAATDLEHRDIGHRDRPRSGVVRLQRQAVVRDVGDSTDIAIRPALRRRRDPNALPTLTTDCPASGDDSASSATRQHASERDIAGSCVGGLNSGGRHYGVAASRRGAIAGMAVFPSSLQRPATPCPFRPSPPLPFARRRRNAARSRARDEAVDLDRFQRSAWPT